MKWGLIGFGSIGKRHASNLKLLGDEVLVVTKNPDCKLAKADSIADLLKTHKPDAVLISNETSLHLQSYTELRAFSKTLPILIEKPLFHKAVNFTADAATFVAYCLRFHPLVQKLKLAIGNAPVLSARFYVGQYLPTWRPDRDYRDTYSAKKLLGGGVLRDLSHELDLASFLLGELRLLFGQSKRVSDLEIDSDDIFTGVFSTEKCPNIVVEMNYLDRLPQRYLQVCTNDQTIKIDFIVKTITVNQQIQSIAFDSNDMYLEMLKRFRQRDYSDACTFSEGLRILDIIEEIEKGPLK